VKKVLVPLDVTTTVDVSMEEIRAAVGSRNDFAKYLVRATAGWVEAMKVLSGRATFNPHDPIALAWLLAPSLFEISQMQILVEERTGKTTGIEAPSGSTCACLRVDVSGFKKIFLDSLGRIAGQAAK
jgi:inosine-uridine nucleoside N-ribohydrolase